VDVSGIDLPKHPDLSDLESRHWQNHGLNHN
jgi:hypothetical protein